MTNQEQYELICEKAEKYDRLVKVIDDIRTDIKEHRLKTQFIDTYDLLGDCLDIIDIHMKESEENNE